MLEIDKMIEEKWYYIRDEARKRNASLVRCDGRLYEVTKSYYVTGPSPLWSVTEVVPVDIPAFISDPSWYD